MNRVNDKIDELIIAEFATHPELVVAFFERLQSNYAEAIRTASALLVSMPAAWFITWEIGAKLSNDKSNDKISIPFLGFPINPDTIIVSPFLIGLLTYGLLSALAAAVVLWEAISRGVNHMLPTAYKHSLDDLLAPPTFSNVERMLEPGPQDSLRLLFSHAWFVVVSLMIFFGSLLALVHTTLLNAWGHTHPALWPVSALLGAIAWLRGVVLFSSAITATGGFNVGHHRGSERAGVGGMPSP